MAHALVRYKTWLIIIRFNGASTSLCTNRGPSGLQVIRRDAYKTHSFARSHIYRSKLIEDEKSVRSFQNEERRGRIYPHTGPNRIYAVNFECHKRSKRIQLAGRFLSRNVAPKTFPSKVLVTSIIHVHDSLDDCLE